MKLRVPDYGPDGTPNKSLQQTGHATDACARHFAPPRVSRLRSCDVRPQRTEGAVYVVGVVLLGLGITLLIMGGVALVAGAPVMGGLVCIGCVPVPMILGGIALVRRAEDRITGGDMPPAERPAAAEVGPTGILDRVRAFDLNRLNWVGWLLLLGTFGFALAEAAALVWIWPGGWDRQLAQLVAPLMVVLAVGFFAGTRWLLGQLGVSIYRRERGRAEPSAAADRGDT